MNCQLCYGLSISEPKFLPANTSSKASNKHWLPCSACILGPRIVPTRSKPVNQGDHESLGQERVRRG
jgi:hypothetical protein